MVSGNIIKDLAQEILEKGSVCNSDKMGAYEFDQLTSTLKIQSDSTHYAILAKKNLFENIDSFLDSTNCIYKNVDEEKLEKLFREAVFYKTLFINGIKFYLSYRPELENSMVIPLDKNIAKARMGVIIQNQN